jgi:pyruvate kinase
MVEEALAVVARAQIGAPGDSVVIAAGVPFGVSGSTNLIRVARIP